MGITLAKSKLELNVGDLADSDTVGSYLVDSLGNLISSQVSGLQQALDVGINVAGVQVDPRQIRALTSADVVTANQGGAPWTQNLTQVGGSAIALGQHAMAASLPVVIASDQSAVPVSGTVAVTQSTSPWVTKDQADGSATGGAAGSFSMLSGAIYNSTPPTLTNGQQASLQLSASGQLLVSGDISSDVADNTADAENPIKVGSRGYFGSPLSALGASNDRADMLSDKYRRVLMSSAAAVAVNPTAVTVGTSAAKLLTSEMSGRMSLILLNNGSKIIYIGKDNTVTTTTGFPVAAGASMSFDLSPEISLWAISGSAGQNVRVLELG